MTISGALNEGAVTLRDQFDCENGAWLYAGRVLHSAHPYGVLTAEQVVEKSDNIGAAKIALRIGAQPPRWLLISPLAAASAAQPAGAPPHCEPAPPEAWQRLSVAAGEPEVFAATSEEFVAQMLNLDVLGAIAFDKGCYTGQEVIARAHYRGRVKRRLQRFVSNSPLRLQPGDTGALNDGRAFKVVNAVALADGRCEFLAVAPFAGEDGAAGRPQPQAERARVIDAQQLALPYGLPP